MKNKSTSNKNRRLKISSKYFSRAYRKTVHYPEIRLCGKWLQELGFKKGQVIQIDCENSKLVITATTN